MESIHSKSAASRRFAAPSQPGKGNGPTRLELRKPPANRTPARNSRKSRHKPSRPSSPRKDTIPNTPQSNNPKHPET